MGEVLAEALARVRGHVAALVHLLDALSGEPVAVAEDREDTLVWPVEDDVCVPGGRELSRLETGEYGPPSDETIERLAAIFETDARELFQLAGRTPVDSHFGSRSPPS
jgi:hypothetical protein